MQHTFSTYSYCTRLVYHDTGFETSRHRYLFKRFNMCYQYIWSLNMMSVRTRNTWTRNGGWSCLALTTCTWHTLKMYLYIQYSIYILHKTTSYHSVRLSKENTWHDSACIFEIVQVCDNRVRVCFVAGFSLSARRFVLWLVLGVWCRVWLGASLWVPVLELRSSFVVRIARDVELYKFGHKVAKVH